MDIHKLRDRLRNEPGSPQRSLPVAKGPGLAAAVAAVAAWLDAMVADGTRPKPVRLHQLLAVFGDDAVYKAVFEHPSRSDLHRAMLDGDRETVADILAGLEVCGVAPGAKMESVLAELQAVVAVSRRRGEVLDLLAAGEPVPTGEVERALIGD